MFKDIQPTVLKCQRIKVCLCSVACTQNLINICLISQYEDLRNVRHFIIAVKLMNKNR